MYNDLCIGLNLWHGRNRFLPCQRFKPIQQNPNPDSVATVLDGHKTADVVRPGIFRRISLCRMYCANYALPRPSIKDIASMLPMSTAQLDQLQPL